MYIYTLKCFQTSCLCQINVILITTQMMCTERLECVFKGKAGSDGIHLCSQHLGGYYKVSMNLLGLHSVFQASLSYNTWSQKGVGEAHHGTKG